MSYRGRFWLIYAVVVAVSLLASVSAFAQETCTSIWELQPPSSAAGQQQDHGASSDPCAYESARIEALGLGLSVSACTASETVMSYHLNGSGAIEDEDRTWNRQPDGCTAVAPETITQLDASRAVMWGLLVLLFGVGYIGGRQR